MELVYQELLRIVASLDSETLRRFKHLRESLGIVVNRYFRRQLAPTREFVTNLLRLEQAYVNVHHPDFNAMEAMNNVVSEQALRESVDSEAGRGARGKQTTQSQESAGLKTYLFGGRGSRNNQQEPVIDSSRGAGAPVIRLPNLPQSIRPSDELTDREHMETEMIHSLVTSYFNIVRKQLTDAVPKAIMYWLVNNVSNGLQAELIKELYGESNNELMKESDDVARRRHGLMEMVSVLFKAQEVVGEIRDVDPSSL